MTTDSTTTATTTSERPEVPAEVLVTIEGAMGQVAAIQDAIEDWAFDPGHSPEGSTIPSSAEETRAAQMALSIASSLLRLYMRGGAPSAGYSSARCAEVEPSERPAVSWELVRSPLYEINSRLHGLMRTAAGAYRARTGDAEGLPEAWEALGQVQTAVSLSLSILTLYEERRARLNPETRGA